MKIISILITFCILWFSQVSADYVRNIDDEIKIHEFKIRLEKYLETTENPEEIKEKYRKLISEKLWKNHDELKRFWPKIDDDSKTFNEYFLKNLYRVFLATDINTFSYVYHYNELKILENDYMRTIARSQDLYIDNDSVYFSNQEWYKHDLLLFLYIDKNQSLQEYIQDNLIEEEFIWKCEVVQKDTSHWTNEDTDFFYIKYTQEYAIKLEEYAQTVPEKDRFDLLRYKNCGKFWYGDISRKTEKLVFYYPHPTEYLGEDFSLIEIK